MTAKEYTEFWWWAFLFSTIGLIVALIRTGL